MENRDDTNCPFCENSVTGKRIIYQDGLVKALVTNIPITPGHVLICPVRHLAKIDELSEAELLAIRDLIIHVKGALTESFGAKGFNIAWNENAVAGQTVGHLHIHLVPRQPGDTGMHGHDPRRFLYRPGSRQNSPESELVAVAKLIKESLKTAS